MKNKKRKYAQTLPFMVPVFARCFYWPWGKKTWYGMLKGIIKYFIDSGVGTIMVAMGPADVWGLLPRLSAA